MKIISPITTPVTQAKVLRKAGFLLAQQYLETHFGARESEGAQPGPKAVEDGPDPTWTVGQRGVFIVIRMRGQKDGGDDKDGGGQADLLHDAVFISLASHLHLR